MTTTSGRLARPIDVAWLAAFRALFGLVMAASALRFIAYGWVELLWIRPTFHFHYWGFDWLPFPSPAGMYALFWGLAALATLVAVGLWFRLSAALFAIGFAYLQLLDVATYLNHYYLATLLAGLLAISPAGRAWSIDARLHPERAVSEIPWAWWALFRFQVGAVYFFAGLAKATSDWLVHAQPLRIWLSSRTELPLIGPVLAQPWAPHVMSWAGFLFDTSIPFLLLVPRIRPWAYLVVIVFHTMTRLLFPIGMFSAIMVLSALVFFSPSWPRKLLGPRAPVTPGGAALPWPRPAIALAGLYVAVQFAMPLRAHLYGGNLLWHEQGMRFSWRVMVREKNGAVTYRVRDPRSGREWLVPARRYVTSVQERELGGQPDLVLQLAKHIARVESERLGAPVEVRADALASLNGRRALPLVDPSVDLARIEDGLGPKSWIGAAPEGPPPAVRTTP